MTKAFVTGANGHLGANLVRELLDHDYDVVAFVRERANLEGLLGVPVELRTGDLLDAPSVERAMKGCGLVFHVGAPHVVWAKEPNEIIEPAVRGTKNVLLAARAHGVSRVVVTSSAAVVGLSHSLDEPRNESAWADSASSPYVLAKNEQERHAWRLAEGLGLDVVTVLPTTMLGRLDFRKTPTSAAFAEMLSGSAPVPHGMNLVDVRDVASCHVLAAVRGVGGERYLAGGDNVTAETLAALIEKHTGQRPKVGLPPLWQLRLRASVSATVCRLRGTPPSITRAMVDDTCTGIPAFDCRKARVHLGLTTCGAEEVVLEALRWALFMGWIPTPMVNLLWARHAPSDAMHSW